MARKMQQKYFEEKRKFSIEALGIAIAKAEEAKRLIEAARYEMPNLIDPKEIHDLALVAQFLHRATTGLPLLLVRHGDGNNGALFGW